MKPVRPWGGRIQWTAQLFPDDYVISAVSVQEWAVGHPSKRPGNAVQDSAKPARPGETIYKGHHSYDLMRNLQLGIIFSIAKSVEQAAAGGLKEPVKDEDFTQQVGCPLLCHSAHAHVC